jgi:hypothetical protein
MEAVLEAVLEAARRDLESAGRRAGRVIESMSCRMKLILCVVCVC